MQALVINHGHVAARQHAANAPGTVPYRQYASEQPTTLAHASGEPLPAPRWQHGGRHVKPFTSQDGEGSSPDHKPSVHRTRQPPQEQQHQRKPPLPANSHNSKRQRQTSPPPPRMLPPRTNAAQTAPRVSNNPVNNTTSNGPPLSAKALRSITKDLLDVLEWQPQRVEDWFVVQCMCGEEVVEVRIGPDGSCVARHNGVFKTCNRIESEVIPAAKNWKVWVYGGVGRVRCCVFFMVFSYYTC